MDNSFDSDLLFMDTQVPSAAPRTTMLKTDQRSTLLDFGLHIITKYTNPEELDVHSFCQHDSTLSFSTKFISNKINSILGYINVSKSESVFSCTLNTENILLNDKQVEPFALNILENNNVLKVNNLSCEINIIQENNVQRPVENHSPTINYFSESSSSSMTNLDNHIKKRKAHNVHDITSQIFDQDTRDIHCLSPILTSKPSCTSPNLLADYDSISMNPVKINVKDEDSTDIEDDITQVFPKDVKFCPITKVPKTKQKIYDPISINEDVYEVQTQIQDNLIVKPAYKGNRRKRVPKIPPNETFFDPFDQCTQIIEMPPKNVLKSQKASIIRPEKNYYQCTQDVFNDLVSQKSKSRTDENYYQNTQALFDDLLTQQPAELPTNSQNTPEMLLIADDKLCNNNKTNCDYKFSSVFNCQLDNTPKIRRFTDVKPAMVSSLDISDSEGDEIPSTPTIAHKRKIPKKKRILKEKFDIPIKNSSKCVAKTSEKTLNYYIKNQKDKKPLSKKPKREK